MSWVQRQMIIGVNPRSLLSQLVTDGTQIPQQIDDLTLWKIIMNMMSEPPSRQKLRHINTLADVVRLIKGAKKIIVLTGAGVSIKLVTAVQLIHVSRLVLFEIMECTVSCSVRSVILRKFSSFCEAHHSLKM